MNRGSKGLVYKVWWAFDPEASGEKQQLDITWVCCIVHWTLAIGHCIDAFVFDIGYYMCCIVHWTFLLHCALDIGYYMCWSCLHLSLAIGAWSPSNAFDCVCCLEAQHRF